MVMRKILLVALTAAAMVVALKMKGLRMKVQ